MSDSISRQAAIDALAEMYCKSDEDGYVWIIRIDAWKRIDALPSVQPEQKHGYWVYSINSESSCEEYTCSLCGAFSFAETNYCPHCGAKMDGVK